MPDRRQSRRSSDCSRHGRTLPCIAWLPDDPDDHFDPTTHPFTVKQYGALRASLRELAALGGKDPAEVEHRYLGEIHTTTYMTALTIDFELRGTTDPNRWRPLRQARERGRLDALLRNQTMMYAIRSGAVQAGLYSDYPDEGFADVEALSPEQLRQAIDAALSKGSIFYDNAGRRPDEQLPEYARFLRDIYVDIVGEEPGYATPTDENERRDGPAMRFFAACLAPVCLQPPSKEKVRRLIQRARSAKGPRVWARKPSKKAC